MRTRPAFNLVGALSLLVVPLLSAQTGPAADSSVVTDSSRKVAKLATITVTASRSERSVFRTPNPALVIDATTIREEAPNGVQDLFRNLPGVDVTGVGPNQGRLIIRGQRGQRILLLENGVRLNNSRRQQDFGELPALTDINGVSRVEIVRGPASVLYGTDAIGGVVNQITKPTPVRGAGNLLRGSVGYRYGSADAQNLVNGRVEGRSGRVGFSFSGSYRDADDYSAPAGKFGALTLNDRARVNDTGVLDKNFAGSLSYDFGPTAALSLRVSHYEADDGGFGYVSPEDLGDPSGATIRILYPTQKVNRATATYEASALAWGIADRVAVTGWTGGNDRTFTIDVGIPLGPTALLTSFNQNVTDISSSGLRMEAVKVFGKGHTLTYGTDFFLDLSTNSDSSLTTITGFGPPMVEQSLIPSVPNAGYRSGGLFAQTDLVLTPRFTLGLGARGQLLTAWTRETDGLEGKALTSATDATVVGSMSGSYAVSEEINLVAVVGRAFRAANLVERFFDGPTPEGSGYQVASPDLRPETSINVDLGAKFRSQRFYAEAFVFRNTIHDGIRIAPTGTKVGPFDAFTNVNVEQLRTQGIELLGEVDLGFGFTTLAHFTKLSSKNVDANNPVGDSFSSKVGGELAWHQPRGRFFAAYEIRHQGERKDIDLGNSLVGEFLPAFTVHNIRGGVRLPELRGSSTSLGLAVMNLTNQLYAEASNTSFFRPEPRRSAVVTVRVDF